MDASNKDKDAEQFSYLPVTCPGCGREGKVNISRLDHTFTCMQCRRVFHLSLQGSVLGARFEPIEVDPYVVSPPPSSRFIRWLEQLPRTAWWGVGAPQGAVVVLALVWLLFFRGGAALPESLDDRARFVAEAVARAEYRRLKAIVPSGAYYSAAEWARNVRPADWPPELPLEQPLDIQLETVFKTSGGDESGAMASAGILVKVKTPAAKSSPEWMLYWIQDSGLQWLFDAKRTAKKG